MSKLHRRHHLSHVPSIEPIGFQPEGYVMTTYESLRRNGPKAALEKFENWVLNLDPDLDGRGDYTLPELHQQYDDGVQRPGGLYQTLIMFDPKLQIPVVTGTIYDLSCDSAKTVYNYLRPEMQEQMDVYTGFLQVNRAIRSQGFGTIMMECMQEHLLQHGAIRGKDINGFSTTMKDQVRKMYDREGGYHSEGTFIIKEWGANHEEEIFTKTYKPKGSPLNNTVRHGKPPQVGGQ